MSDTATQTAALLALLSRFDMGEFEYRDATRHIRITGGGPLEAEATAVAVPAPVASAQAVPRDAIRSPGVGSFCATKRDGLPRAISRGEVLGTLRTGLVLMPIVAPADAVLVAIRHEDGKGVGYDMVLFDIDRTDRG